MKLKVLIVTIFLVWAIQPLRAQEENYEDKYFPAINERLTEGDCQRAQRLYNVYKELTNKTNLDIERQITLCNEGNRTKRKSSINGYVGLGLPSGTLWKDKNETGYYSFKKAIAKYGSQLPSKEQFEELIRECKWEWTGAGYKVVGKNGNYILIPAAGYNGEGIAVGVIKIGEYGLYWTSTSGSRLKRAYYFQLSQGQFCIYQENDKWHPATGNTVRLVRNY